MIELASEARLRPSAVCRVPGAAAEKPFLSSKRIRELKKEASSFGIHV